MDTTMVRVTRDTLRKLKEAKKVKKAKSYDQLISDVLDHSEAQREFSAEVEREFPTYDD